MKLMALMAGMMLLATAALPAGAQGAPGSATAGTKEGSVGQATARLRDFFARDWKYWMQEYPEAATAFGYPGLNDRWTDLTPTAIERRDKHLDASLKELHAISRAELPPAEQLNYDLYESLLQTAIAGLAFHDDADPFASVVPSNLYMPLNQMQGIPQDIPSTLDHNPAANAKDYQDIIARLNGVPALVDQTIALMKRGEAAGWTPPRITMRDVPKQFESQIVSDATASPMLEAFKHFPETIPANQQKDLTSQAVKAYTEQVAPAFKKMRDFLVNAYIPGCRETISANDLPQGSDYYKYLVRWQTTTRLTPAQIHQIGLDQVKTIRAQMDETIAQSGFHGSFADFIHFLNTDPQFYFTSADDLVVHSRNIAKEIDPKLAQLFGKLPRLPYGVRPVPAAVAPSQTTGFYDPGSPVAGRPGWYNVNTYKLESRPKWAMVDLTLHEAVPGHHLQISLAQEMENQPEFRKQTGYTAFVEGWGLYAESLGNEMGFYADPYVKFGYLSAQMWRAVRLVVDTGMHSMGWTRDQAIKYFIENSGQPEQNVVVEVDRYIVWPGQALGYKIGQLKILELRAEAEKELGAKFDIRAFHDEVVDQGAVPLAILESRVHAWIARQKSAAAN